MGWTQIVSFGFVNPMTTVGDIIYENSTPAPARLGGNINARRNFLTSTGTGSIPTAPAWTRYRRATTRSSSRPALRSRRSGAGTGRFGLLPIRHPRGRCSLASAEQSVGVRWCGGILTPVGIVPDPGATCRAHAPLLARRRRDLASADRDRETRHDHGGNLDGTVIGVDYGGTGTTATPTAGQLLVGTAAESTRCKRCLAMPPSLLPAPSPLPQSTATLARTPTPASPWTARVVSPRRAVASVLSQRG